MTNQEAIEKLKEILFMTGYKEALDLAIKALESQPQWIPVETRDLTAEEIEELMKAIDIIDSDDIEHWCYCCPLPDDNQDVLVTTHYGVTTTTFYNDNVYGAYFEDYEDRDDVLAWMPFCLFIR